MVGMATYSIQGVVYPLQVNPATGGLLTATDGDLIAGHVRSMLETEPGENPMRPEYGVPGVLFSTIPDFAVYGADVRRRLKAEIPQAEFVVSAELGDSGQGQLTVAWSFAGVPGDSLSLVLE
jgi:hypothetical protein